MTTLLNVEDVPAAVLERIRQRADVNRRSLHQEVVAILSEAATPTQTLGEPLVSTERPAPYDLDIDSSREPVTPRPAGEPQLDIREAQNVGGFRPDELVPDVIVPINLPRPEGGQVYVVRFDAERLPTRRIADEETPE